MTEDKPTRAGGFSGNTSGLAPNRPAVAASSRGRAEEHPKSWLICQIVDAYPCLSASMVRDLLNRRRILPVLDGLDELPAAERPLALRKLNSGCPAHEPLVLTCRTHDYAKAIRKGPVLRSARWSRAGR
ncbi:hypothetical protein AB0E96_18250 [Kitasatospora sp. NPDC036755]|uniref:hypothetical protein n=1 Tax=Kitasatospora sp. NPDC036755 TaxID=3154600 RepID=UPI0033F068D4